MTARARLVAALAAALLLSGCTGVPSSSSPQVVNPVGVEQPSAPPAITPQLNADPRTMVTDFLTAGATDDPRHLAAHGFLTPDASQRWSDATVTVLDSVRVGNFVDGTVTVTGRPVGSISATGIYRAALQGNGSGGAPISISFPMKRVNGQWRIDNPPVGVILTYDQFQLTYQQRPLYFFDLTEQHLVPDPRYSALSDPAKLATWLISQLAAGPRAELQNALSPQLPAQIDPSRVSVTLGSPVKVQLPGASQLDAQTRDRLAAQVAATLEQVATGAQFTILDAGRPVSIPQGGGDAFGVAGFESIIDPPAPAPLVFYVRNGGVVDQDGKPLAGDVGNGHYGLNSVALTSLGSSDLRIAATSGAGTNARLLVGSRDTALRNTSVPRGPLSRPAWVPTLNEAWVGDGSAIFRVGSDGKARPVPVTSTTGAISGRVSALRFSPEGSRVAIVLTGSDGTAQVWLGSVVRNSDSSQVRVDSLQAISPQGVGIVDVAWNGALTLVMIGRDRASGDPSVYEVQVDGSLWTARGIGNLPVPDSITVAERQAAWVSAGGTVWAQQASGWSNRGSDAAFCTNPVYLE